MGEMLPDLYRHSPYQGALLEDRGDRDLTALINPGNFFTSHDLPSSLETVCALVKKKKRKTCALSLQMSEKN
jgi:hypothetical protein